VSDERCESCGGDLTVTSLPGASPLIFKCQRCGRERAFEVQYAPPPSGSASGAHASTSFLPEAAIAALGAGNKIDAIKIVREATGLGLKEAKEAVEQYVPGDRPFRAPERPSAGADAFPLAAVSALQNGKFIDAVKIVRQAQGGGLKDAKSAVDRYLASEPLIRGRFEAAQGDSRRGALLWLMALALLTALVAYLFVT